MSPQYEGRLTARLSRPRVLATGAVEGVMYGLLSSGWGLKWTKYRPGSKSVRLNASRTNKLLTSVCKNLRRHILRQCTTHSEAKSIPHDRILSKRGRWGQVVHRSRRRQGTTMPRTLSQPLLFVGKSSEVAPVVGRRQGTEHAWVSLYS
jgi:hypothetical protein